MTPENYVPVEKKFGLQLKYAAKDFLSTVYGFAITPYRVPTTIRKYFNKQCFFQKPEFTERNKIGEKLNVPGIVSGFAGALTGATVFGIEMAHTLLPLIEDNNRLYHYIPLMVMGATNAASVGFEIVNGIFQAGKRAGRKSLENSVKTNFQQSLNQDEKDFLAKQFREGDEE